MKTSLTPKTPRTGVSEKNIKYVFSSKTYLKGANHNRAREGKEYIYVLFASPYKNGKTFPYFVGSASELSRHFEAHEQIQWHHNLFHNDTIVHIIASVPTIQIEEAKAELITALMNKGYKLNNNSFPLSLLSLNKKEITAYFFSLKKLNELNTIIKDQVLKWSQRESDSAAASHIIRIKQNKISPSSLYRFISKRKYENKGSKTLSQRLAKVFSSETKTSTHFFYLSEEEDPQLKINSIVQDIKGLKGDWFIDKNTPLKFNTLIRFHLAESVEKGLESSLGFKSKTDLSQM